MSFIDAINASIEGAFHYMNSSKYFAGIAMLLLNLGSRYISAELSEMHETVLNHKIIRRLLVFVVVFIATKDAKVSLILTAIFVILVSGIFNEESKYCIIPSVKNKNDITKTEYQLAQEVVKRYNTHKQRKEMQHIRSIKK